MKNYLEVKYEDIVVVKRKDLKRESLLKELHEIVIDDLKDKRIALRAKCLVFRDYNNKIKVLK